MKIKSILIDTDEGHFFIGTSVVKAKTFTGIERKLKGKNIVAMKSKRRSLSQQKNIY